MRCQNTKKLTKFQLQNIKLTKLKGLTMASGRKDYFRHSVHAYNDEKMQQLRDEGGLEAIAIFWITMELCGREYTQSGERENFIFRQSYLARTVGKRWPYLEVTYRLLSRCGLVTLKLVGDTAELYIPNFKKFIGSYTIEEPLNKVVKTPNKKKRKEKKGKEEKTPSKLNIVVDENKLTHVDIKYHLPDLAESAHQTIMLCDRDKFLTFVKEYGDATVEDYAQRLHDYVESTGKKYKCYVSAMRTWARKDGLDKLPDIAELEKAFGHCGVPIVK